MKRIYHHWETWECVPAGLYGTGAGRDPEEAKQCYAAFLSDSDRFEKALRRVLAEWPISCEQFLSNESINRIAWLGQAAMCIETGTPSVFRGGFKRISAQQQRTANALAAAYLEKWLRRDAKQSRKVHQHLETAGLFS